MVINPLRRSTQKFPCQTNTHFASCICTVPGRANPHNWFSQHCNIPQFLPNHDQFCTPRNSAYNDLIWSTYFTRLAKDIKDSVVPKLPNSPRVFPVYPGTSHRASTRPPRPLPGVFWGSQALIEATSGRDDTHLRWHRWNNHPWRIHGAGIYTKIWGILMVNVTIYSIHGSYGPWCLKEQVSIVKWI